MTGPRTVADPRSEGVTDARDRASRTARGAFAISLVAIVVWILAGAMDELYVVQGLLGLVAATLGVVALRRLGRHARDGKLALAAIVLGGASAVAVGTAAIVFAVTA